MLPQDAQGSLDFIVVIPLNDILPVRLFDLKVYNAFHGIHEVHEEEEKELEEDAQTFDDKAWLFWLLWPAILAFLAGAVASWGLEWLAM